MNPAKETLLRRVHALFFVMLAVTFAVAFIAIRTIDRAQRSSDWVNQTHGLIYELDGMSGGLRSGEGRLRTYALTGDAEDLALARAELGAVIDHLAVARAMLKAEAGAVASLDALERVVQQRLEFADAIEAARGPSPSEELATVLRRDAANPATAEFVREIERLRSHQFELLSERDRESYRQANDTRWVVLAGAAVNLLLAIGVAWIVREDIANRRRMTAALQAANESLEQRVRERTAELSAANRSLLAENRARKWTSLSQEHQLRYNQLIINSVGDLVLVLTKTLTVTRVNHSVVRATRLEEDALLGQPLSRFLSCADGTGLESAERSLKEGRELTVAGRLLGRDRATQDVVATFVPLRDQDQVVGGIAVLRHQPTPNP